MSWQQRIDQALSERRQADAFRRRQPVAQGAGRWLIREDRRWLNFSSNDYLGLSQHPQIIAAWQQGAARYGVGSGGSGHVSGYSEAHRELEESLADWLGYPRALLFIGPVTEKKLARIGIHTIGDLANAPETTLRSLLGKWAHTLRQYALGHEYAPVAYWGESPPVKSIGNSTTLPKNLAHADAFVPVVYMLCECVAERLRLSHLRAEVLHLWLRDADLCSQTRQIQLGAPTQVSGRLAKACFRLIHKHWDGAPIRSIGVQVSQLSFEKDAYQLSIFSQKEQKNAELERCIDDLRHRFGHWSIARAVTLQDTQLKIDPLEENSLHSVAFRKGVL